MRLIPHPIAGQVHGGQSVQLRLAHPTQVRWRTISPEFMEIYFAL